MKNLIKTNKTFSSDLCQKWAEENNMPICDDSWFNQKWAEENNMPICDDSWFKQSDIDGKPIVVDKYGNRYIDGTAYRSIEKWEK